MKLWKTLAILVCLALCIAVIASAEEEAALILPDDLVSIEAGAFEGALSAEYVIVPEGSRTIGARAFADSALTRIRLPGTIQFIASDAFSGCKKLVAVVDEGSYALRWCVMNGIQIEAQHLPNEYCICLACGKEVHSPDENCRCMVCNMELHEMQSIETDEGTPCYSCSNCDYAEHWGEPIADDSETFRYSDITPTTHRATREQVCTVSCSACGTVTSRSTVVLEDKTFRHDDLAQCGACGYVCDHGRIGQQKDSFSEMQYEGFDEQGHTVLESTNLLTVCLDCESILASDPWQKRYKEAHIFDQDYVCWWCGYQKEDSGVACTHERMSLIEEYRWFDAEEYTDITEATHTVVGTQWDDLKCLDCGEYDYRTYTRSYTEKHVFVDGVCVLCDCGGSGETGEHSHVFPEDSCVCSDCGETEHDDSFWNDIHAECLRCGEIHHEWMNRTVLENVTGYEALNEQSHYAIGTLRHYLECMDDGEVIEDTVYGERRVVEAHYFVDGACADCGFDGCTHAELNSKCVCLNCGKELHSVSYGCECDRCGQNIHSDDILDGDDRFFIEGTSYEPFDGAQHWVEGTAYTVCENCAAFGASPEVVAKDLRVLEKHTFVLKDGIYACDGCGYVLEDAVCAHENIITRQYTRMKRMTGITETHEIGIGDLEEDYLCADCGEYLKTVVLVKNIEEKTPHCYFYNYRDESSGWWGCFNCGYVSDCLHENIAWKISGTYAGIYTDTNAYSHTFRGIVDYTGSCADCGAPVYTNDGESPKHYGEITQPHTFENGVCTACGQAG